MDIKLLPYIALLLLFVVGVGSCMHRKHLDFTLKNIQEQVDRLDKRHIDPDNIPRLKIDLAACRQKLKRYE